MFQNRLFVVENAITTKAFHYIVINSFDPSKTGETIGTNCH